MKLKNFRHRKSTINKIIQPKRTILKSKLNKKLLQAQKNHQQLDPPQKLLMLRKKKQKYSQQLIQELLVKKDFILK